eukprot:CAMPEP_0194092660 /NCGR_PEP_ID=MMETSP0149-20130528/47553_1 /TAXON_ID=122233 /ORGANISM="Chaetoceros debilis, Strain MM31A-1" /LENGTH=707 /DNA_ID=CAMNT_0038777685 /DNA_START=77 /DNA_END=2200 /DNA_ORIENTATION=+
MPSSTMEPSFPSYNEWIHLSKQEDLAKVVLQTSTTIGINTSNDDKDSGGSPRSLLLPIDSILISIMDRYGLDSLTLSVSSSSSMQYEYSGNHESGSLSFPVGTAVQYSSSVPSKDDSRKIKKYRRMETQMEYELMQLLSSKNLFCENVQLEPLRNGHIRSIEMPTSTNGQCDGTMASQDNQTCSANIEHNYNSKKKIIMLPREAYSLCQTRALWDKIISSAPCRDRAGIFSYLQRDLNGMEILHKMSWVQVNRQLQQGMDANESSIQVNIDKGLAFTRWLEDADDDGSNSDSDSNEAEHVSLSALLAGGEFYYDDGRVDTLKHCPLSDSSKVIVQDGNGGIVLEHDLTKSSLDVSAKIDFGSRRRPLHKSAREIEMGMEGDDSNDNIQQSLGIERTVFRLNGISNRGMLQTRVYQSLESSFAQKCGDDSDGDSDGDRGVIVSLVDVFPKIIIPVYHSMRIFVVEGMGSGDEFHAFDSEFQSEHSIDGYSVTQYNIRELDHKLTLTPTSDEPTLETLSITMVIPEDSSIYVQLEYEPRFLSFEEFPADPNRGFDVPPSIATFSCNAVDNSHTNANANRNIAHVYSNALLIMPPVPDLSMPFNVISITSTFLALILGTLINILIRKATGRITDELKSEEEKEKEKSISEMTKLKGRVKTILKRVKGGRKVIATASKEVTNSNCDMDNGTDVHTEKGQETLKRENALIAS